VASLPKVKLDITKIQIQILPISLFFDAEHKITWAKIITSQIRVMTSLTHILDLLLMRWYR